MTVDRAWTSVRMAGLDPGVAMPLLNLNLKLADLYAGLVFQPQPTQVEGGQIAGKCRFDDFSR